jgi:hypothetical protein
MIVIKLVDRIKPTPYIPNHLGWKAPSYDGNAGTDTWKEAKRRDEIIKKMYKECKYYPGQKLIPDVPGAFAEHGECTVVGVCSSYVLYGKDIAWPASDNPLIVTVITSKNTTLFTTNNYFKAV